MNCERYRLVLYHDMILNDSATPIDNPIAVNYYIDKHFIDTLQGDRLIIINEIVEQFKSYMLNYFS